MFPSSNVVLYLIFTLETLLLKTAQNASLVGGRDDKMLHSQPIRSHYWALADQWGAGTAEDRCCRLFALHTVCRKCVCTSPTIQHPISSLDKLSFWILFIFLYFNYTVRVFFEKLHKINVIINVLTNLMLSFSLLGKFYPIPSQN